MQVQPKEKDFSKLTLNYLEANTPEEEEVALKKIKDFTKANSKLVDEIQSRRWINYGD